MTASRKPTGWPWTAPPYFALIRGPFGRAGYQVATVVRDDDPLAKIVLLFSSEERAEAHRKTSPQGHSDWRLGPLPSWERLAYFLGTLRTSASLVCVDFRREGSANDLAVPLEDVVPRLEALGRGEGTGAGD